MKRIAILTLATLLMGCAKTLYVPVERTRTITETLHDTVVITKLEKETTNQRVRDTTSKVETKYASSTATWHGSTNELEHSLTTKDTPFEVRVQYVERVVVDSVPVPYPVEVEKLVPEPTRLALRWWEQTQIKGFWVLVIIMVFVCRKKIASLIRRFI